MLYYYIERWYVIMDKEYTYSDGFEDGMNEKESDIIELLNNLLSDKSLDSHTLNIVIKKINEL